MLESQKRRTARRQASRALICEARPLCACSQRSQRTHFLAFPCQETCKSLSSHRRRGLGPRARFVPTASCCAAAGYQQTWASLSMQRQRRLAVGPRVGYAVFAGPCAGRPSLQYFWPYNRRLNLVQTVVCTTVRYLDPIKIE